MKPHKYLRTVEFSLITAILIFIVSIHLEAQPDEWEYYDPFWQNISSITQEGDYIWIGKSSGGAVRFNRITEEMEYYKRYFTGLTGNSIRRIVVDDAGNKWFGIGISGNTEEPGIAKYDGFDWTIFNANNSPLREDTQDDFAVDKSGNLWVGTAEDGLLKYDGTVWVQYDTINSGIPSNNVRNVAIDKDGVIWFLAYVDKGYYSYNSLIKYDGISWTLNQPDSSGLPGFDYSKLVIDNDDNKWMAAYGMILKYDNTSFTTYLPYLEGIITGNIYDLDIDSEGNCFIATNDTGLVKLDVSGNWTVFNISDIQNGNWVHDVYIDENNIKWLSTIKGLTKFDETELKSYQLCNAPLISSRSSDVYIEKSGTIWFGDYGITKYDGSSWRRFDYTNSILPFSTITHFTMDADNNLWAGTGAGLIKLKDTTITIYDIDNSDLPDNNVTDIAVDKNNILWITTGNGIVRMEKDSMTIYDENNAPLDGDYMFTVEVDRNNVKWFGGMTCELVKYDDISWHVFNVPYPYSWYDEINDLSIDIANRVVIANSVIQTFTGSTWNLIEMPDTLNLLIEVEADSIGNIWTSSYQRGIVKIDPWNNITIFNNKNSGLIGVNQMVQSTRVDNNGYKYFCTNDGGVSVYKGDLVLDVLNDHPGVTPTDYRLDQNYPNPFNPVTNITYYLSNSVKVKITVYDLLGREVKTLVNDFQAGGEHSVQFDGSLISSGVYFYTLNAGDFNVTKKLTLMK